MTKVTKAEWNRMIDEFVEKDNKLKGKVSVPGFETKHREEFPLVNRFVTEDLIRHFAEAMGDPNPLYRYPMYGRSTRWGSMVAPPTFEYCIAYPSTQVTHGDLVEGWGNMYGGTKRIAFKPIHPGDEFRVVDRYLGTVEKTNPARPYRLFLRYNERSYINQRDEAAVVITAYTVNPAIYPGEVPAVRSRYAGRETPHHFTDEELEFIHNAYDEELAGKWRRGAEIRYWEDVIEGEDLHPVIKGPLHLIDIITSHAALGFTWEGAFAMAWRLIKPSLPNPALKDPQDGEYHPSIVGHYVDWINQRHGLPRAIARAVQHEMNIAHLISNWMGDDGFVKCLELQCREVTFLGEMSTIKGKVIKKHVENNEHLVDLEVWGETETGIKHTVGTASVRLLSRNVK
jgi:acyl dehydratase